MHRPPISTLFPTRRSSDLVAGNMPRHDVVGRGVQRLGDIFQIDTVLAAIGDGDTPAPRLCSRWRRCLRRRSEEHTSELQSRQYLVCRLLLEKKKVEPPAGD